MNATTSSALVELAHALDRVATAGTHLLYTLARVRLLTECDEPRFLVEAAEEVDEAADALRLADALVLAVLEEAATEAGVEERTLAALAEALPPSQAEPVLDRRDRLAVLRADIEAEIAAAARLATAGVSSVLAAQDAVWQADPAPGWELGRPVTPGARLDRDC